MKKVFKNRIIGLALFSLLVMLSLAACSGDAHKDGMMKDDGMMKEDPMMKDKEMMKEDQMMKEEGNKTM